MFHRAPRRRHKCVGCVSLSSRGFSAMVLPFSFSHFLLMSIKFASQSRGLLIPPDRLQYCTFSLSPQGGNEMLCSALAPLVLQVA